MAAGCVRMAPHHARSPPRGLRALALPLVLLLLLVVALLLALAAAPVHAAADSESAALNVNATAANEEDVTALLHARAAGGDAEAMLALGLRALQAAEAEKEDEDVATHWFRAAAKRGSPGGMYEFGKCYAGGRDVARNDAEAQRWFRAAAEAGHARAMTEVGRCCLKGCAPAGRNCAEPDAVEAVEWVNGAAHLDDSEAMVLLGDMYVAGIGLTASMARALKWYSRALNTADGSGAAGAALARLEALAYSGSVESMRILVNYIMSAAAFSSLSPGNHTHAHAHTHMFANSTSAFDLAVHWSVHEPVASGPISAELRSLMELMADRGGIEAALFLTELHRTGSSCMSGQPPAQNPNQALHWLRKAVLATPRDQPEQFVQRHHSVALHFSGCQRSDMRLFLRQCPAQSTSENATALTEVDRLLAAFGDQRSLSVRKAVAETALWLLRREHSTASPESMGVSVALKSVAAVNTRLGALDDARHAMELALEMEESMRAYGAKVPVEATMASLARVYRKVGERRLQLAALDRILALDSLRLGNEHPSLIATLVLLTDAHTALGNYTHAEALRVRAHAIAARLPESVNETLLVCAAGDGAWAIGKIGMEAWVRGDVRTAAILTRWAMTCLEEQRTDETEVGELLSVAANALGVALIAGDVRHFREVLVRALIMATQRVPPDNLLAWHPIVALATVGDGLLGLLGFLDEHDRVFRAQVDAMKRYWPHAHDRYVTAWTIGTSLSTLFAAAMFCGEVIGMTNRAECEWQILKPAWESRLSILGDAFGAADIGVQFSATFFAGMAKGSNVTVHLPESVWMRLADDCEKCFQNVVAPAQVGADRVFATARLSVCAPLFLFDSERNTTWSERHELSENCREVQRSMFEETRYDDFDTAQLILSHIWMNINESPAREEASRWNQLVPHSLDADPYAIAVGRLVQCSSMDSQCPSSPLLELLQNLLNQSHSLPLLNMAIQLYSSFNVTDQKTLYAEPVLSALEMSYGQSTAWGITIATTVARASYEKDPLVRSDIWAQLMEDTENVDSWTNLKVIVATLIAMDVANVVTSNIASWLPHVLIVFADQYGTRAVCGTLQEIGSSVFNDFFDATWSTRTSELFYCVCPILIDLLRPGALLPLARKGANDASLRFGPVIALQANDNHMEVALALAAGASVYSQLNATADAAALLGIARGTLEAEWKAKRSMVHGIASFILAAASDYVSATVSSSESINVDQVITVAEQIYGSSHPFVIAATALAGLVVPPLKTPDAAAGAASASAHTRYLGAAVLKMETFYGRNHLYVLMAKYALGIHYQQTHSPDLAQEQFQQSLVGLLTTPFGTSDHYLASAIRAKLVSVLPPAQP